MKGLAKAHQFLTFTTPPNLQAAVAYGLSKDDAYFEGMRTRLRPGPGPVRGRPDGARLQRAAIRRHLLPQPRHRPLGESDDVAFCERLVRAARRRGDSRQRLLRPQAGAHHRAVLLRQARRHPRPRPRAPARPRTRARGLMRASLSDRGERGHIPEHEHHAHAPEPRDDLFADGRPRPALRGRVFRARQRLQGEPLHAGRSVRPARQGRAVDDRSRSGRLEPRAGAGAARIAGAHPRHRDPAAGQPAHRPRRDRRPDPGDRRRDHHGDLVLHRLGGAPPRRAALADRPHGGERRDRRRGRGGAD